MKGGGRTEVEHSELVGAFLFQRAQRERAREGRETGKWQDAREKKMADLFAKNRGVKMQFRL